MSEKKTSRRISIKGPFITIKTDKFLKLYDTLGKRRFTKIASIIMLYLMPVIAAFSIYFLLITLQSMLSTAEIREVTRDLGPQSYLLLPGINPIVPIIYGWLGIVVGIIVHEGGHGIVARSLGVKVKSSGILLFLIIPIGAFVEIDEKKIKSMSITKAGKILAAGPGANVIIAIISLLLLFSLTSTIHPIPDTKSGLKVGNILEEFPVGNSGLESGDIIIEADGKRIMDIKDLTTVLSENKNNMLNLKVIKIDNSIREYNVELVENDDSIKIGITALPTTYLNQILKTYKTNYFSNPLIHLIPPTLAQGVIPFSDGLSPFYETSLGTLFHPLTNTLYWIWFININLAIFNSLPLLPLDGGHALRNIMKNTIGKRFGEKTSNRITYLISLMMIIIILLLVLIPYII